MADITAREDNEAAKPGRLSPSDFMRNLRPEYYSDTEDHASYVLDTPTFDHHLDTITSRNETHDFELFARKLCERAICPNLRPQTGPEGGGDSKADTETYPVADEISRIYIGDANGGRERWAFAFSAKKKWSEKVRKDVKGIVETGRSYDHVICVTSRYARSRDRARLEHELSKKYGISVTIHDRSWIIKEIIESDRKDLAFNYLGIGEVKNDPLRLGPTDYSRTQQLDAIEKSLEESAGFRGIERQRVSEALIAAKLSRNLERPRIETDGRFQRAIRLADESGSFRQKLEARYEHIWTSFWYFDDVELVNQSYSAFESMAIKTDHAANLELLSNLFQLLVNAVVHGHLSRVACKLDERAATLRQVLEAIAANTERPNNSLEAQASLLNLRLNSVFIDEKPRDLPAIWRDYGGILDRAAGLGEFKAERLVSMIEIAGQVAGNDPAYNELIEKLASFVSKRKSEAEGALILLKRAQQLDFSDRIDMIRLLGKAAYGLSKKEHAESLIEALHLLMIAYRSAGLLWAARATCIMAAAMVAIEGEPDSTIPVLFIPTTKVWAWTALGLRHLPDLLLTFELLNGMLAILPLTADSKDRLHEDIRELEYALASIFLTLDDAALRQLDGLPDVLEKLELFVARAALLYTLGYSAVLREDGSIPKEETDEGAHALFSTLASQPVARQTYGPVILHGEGPQILVATILGMTVEISFDGTDQLTLVGEAILGSLEAFFATAIDQRVIPHTEKLRINLVASAEASKASIEINALDMVGTVTWPQTFSMTNSQQQLDIRKFLAKVSGHVLATTCIIDDVKALLSKLHDDEAVLCRMAMIPTVPSSYHRVASKILSRVSDWKDAVYKHYPLQEPRPVLTIVKLEPPQSEGDGNDGEINNHRALRVRSVIDVHAWERAAWAGTCYVEIRPRRTPGIAFMFKDREAGRKIFERWRERFGTNDANEEIYLAIVRNLPGQNPHHYIVLITSKLPPENERDPDQLIVTANRSMTMTPESGINLQRFLDAYDEFREFYVMPAVLVNGVPEVMQDLAVLKRHISVKDAKAVGEHDIEMMALGNRFPEILSEGSKRNPG